MGTNRTSLHGMNANGKNRTWRKKKDLRLCLMDLRKSVMMYLYRFESMNMRIFFSRFKKWNE